MILNSKGERVEAGSLLTEKENARCEMLSNDVLKNGYDVDITTMTAILKMVAEQKFYEIPMADYLPIKVGEGTAWAEDILAYREYIAGGDFEKGYINEAVGSRLATTDANLDSVRVKVKTWAKEIAWSLPELQKASRTGVWDIVSVKEKARKKNWDLGLQQIVFLGNSQGMKGLLNLSGVTTDSGNLIPAKLSLMTNAQFGAFVAKAIAAYQANCKYTAMPDYLIVPQDDFNGLAVPADNTYSFLSVSRIEMLEQAFSRVTGKPFKVKPLAYAMASISGLSKDRYVLGRMDEEVARFEIPVDYTTTQANSIEGFTFRNVAFAQHSEVLCLRPLEMFYMDIA